MSESPHIIIPSSPSPLPSFGNDIECIDWLEEVNLPQYKDTFLTNFGVYGKLSRSRLKTVRLQDFQYLNIQDYDNAKLLMEHIKITLQYSFNSSERVYAIQERRKSLSRPNSTSFLPNIINKGSTIGLISQLPTQLIDVRIDNSKRRINHQRFISDHQQQAFDRRNWNSIQLYRDDHNHSNLSAVESLRDGKAKAQGLVQTQSYGKTYIFIYMEEIQFLLGYRRCLWEVVRQCLRHP